VDRPDRDRALGEARWTAALLGASPLLLTALAGLVSPSEGFSWLVVPAGVLGLVAPAVAWRLQARLRASAGGGAEEGRRVYLRSLTVGLAVTELASMLGVGVWLVTREVQALIGLPMHLLMVGALWPTEERLRQAEEDIRE
jgi:hypothetical protein